MGRTWISLRQGSGCNKQKGCGQVGSSGTSREASQLGLWVWQLRQISGQTGLSAQNILNVHFGLGDASIIDSIKVEWPSGLVQVRTDVEANQFHTITEGLCGDGDRSGSINILDVTHIINYLYKDGAPPDPDQIADVDGSGSINLLDVTNLIDYLCKYGPEPVC